RGARRGRGPPRASWGAWPPQERTEHQRESASEDGAEEQEGHVHAERAGVRVAAEGGAQHATLPEDHAHILSDLLGRRTVQGAREIGERGEYRAGASTMSLGRVSARSLPRSQTSRPPCEAFRPTPSAPFVPAGAA